MSRANESGIALAGAVTGMAALAVVAVGLARRATFDQRRTAAAVAGMRADALLRSGVSTAAALLGDHRSLGLPDSPHAPWAADFGRQPVGDGWVTLRVEDETRRLDLNHPVVPGVLGRLLARLELDAHLADGVADWQDDDDDPRPWGAERRWYAARHPPLVPADGPLQSVGELGAIRGFDPAALARVRPFVTVTETSGINPNTASTTVLEAWLDDPLRVRDIVARREQGLVACEELPGCTLHTQHFRVHVEAEVDDVRRAAEAVLWVPGVDAEVVSWRRVAPEEDRPR